MWQKFKTSPFSSRTSLPTTRRLKRSWIRSSLSPVRLLIDAVFLIILPAGVETYKGSDCFIYWCDLQNSLTWGLNFVSSEDANVFLAIVASSFNMFIIFLKHYYFVSERSKGFFIDGFVKVDTKFGSGKLTVERALSHEIVFTDQVPEQRKANGHLKRGMIVGPSPAGSSPTQVKVRSTASCADLVKDRSASIAKVSAQGTRKVSRPAVLDTKSAAHCPPVDLTKGDTTPLAIPPGESLDTTIKNKISGLILDIPSPENPSIGREQDRLSKSLPNVMAKCHLSTASTGQPKIDDNSPVWREQVIPEILFILYTPRISTLFSFQTPKVRVALSLVSCTWVSTAPVLSSESTWSTARPAAAQKSLLSAPSVNAARLFSVTNNQQHLGRRSL